MYFDYLTTSALDLGSVPAESPQKQGHVAVKCKKGYWIDLEPDQSGADYYGTDYHDKINIP